ncbi:D-inositol-3-phosphate glycosyltransferase [subsurface metagenome]
MSYRQENSTDGMKICVVGSSKRFFSGITTQTIFLANALAKRNQVSVIPLRNLLPRFLFPGHKRVGKDQYSVDFAPGIDVYEGMDYNSPRSWLGAYRFLREHRPEAIIMLWWTSSVAHMQIFLKLVNSLGVKAKMILEMHEVVDPLEESILPIRLYSRVAGRRLMRGLDAYTTKSHFNKTQVAQIYGISEDMISVVPLGLYEDYKQELDRVQSRRELGIAEEFVILYFGLIRHYKGVPYLIEAFNGLPSSVADRSRLLIVGEVWEEGEVLQEMIDASTYKSQISLVAQYVPDALIPKYFSAADVVALPYLRAAGSAVAHIAMTYGKPIILSDVAALKETLRDYQGAMFTPPGDSLAIRDNLLETYEILKLRGAVYYAPPQRTWDDIARQYEAILDKLISERGITK